jgi:fucose permease
MTTARGVRTGWLTAACYGGMFAFGIVMAVIGALLPRLSIGLVQSGNLFLGLTSTMLASMLFLGPAMDRFGKKLPLAAGAFLVALALALMAVSRTYESLLIAVALLGLGGGALNGGTNLLIADLHADARRKNSALSALGIFYGFGALCLPFVLGALVERLGAGPILWAAALAPFASAALFASLAFPPPKRAGGLPLGEVARFARNPLVLLFGFLLFFQSGNEFLIGGYTSTYLVREIGFNVRTASYLLAAYWAALMLARVVLARLLLHAKGPGVVILSGVGQVAGACLMIFAPSGAVAAAGVVVMGISFASVYPTVLGLAGARFEQASGTVFGILFAIALTGGMLLPWSAGRIAAAGGLRGVLVLAAAGGLLIALLQTVIARRLRVAPH